MTETLGLMLRVGLSFTFVLGLMFFTARMLRGKMAGRGAGALEVLARQQVGRGASVAVVRVADRALIVGITEHGVNILGDPLSDLTPFTAPTVEIPGQPTALSAGTRRSTLNAAAPANGKGALNGSILSPATWRQALELLRERTVRR